MNIVQSILIPGYEDYEKYGPVRHYLKHWPDMWPEEAYAELKLWEEYKTRHDRYPIFMMNAVQWNRQHMRKGWARYQLVAYALASLARECGWTVKNGYDVEVYGVPPIYNTDSPVHDHEPKPEEQPVPEGMEIDMEMLAKMMGDMKPVVMPSFQRTKIRLEVKPTNRATLQSLVLADLVAGNGWKVQKGNRSNNYKDIYKIA